MAENPFLKALDVLDERGWYQGDFESSDGRVCLFGALNVACGGVPSYDLGAADESRFIAEVAEDQELIGSSVFPAYLADWNDAEGTSEEDVRLLFKHAAQAWEERE